MQQPPFGKWASFNVFVSITLNTNRALGGVLAQSGFQMRELQVILGTIRLYMVAKELPEQIERH